MGTWNYLTSWPGHNAALFSFILFLCATIISIYAAEVRRFIHFWPQKAGDLGRRAASNRLVLLKQLNGSAYHLLFYFARETIQTFFEWLLLAMAFTLYWAVRTVKPSPSLLVPLFLGTLAGRLNDIRMVLKQLATYDKSVEKLQYLAGMTANADTERK